MHQGLKVLFFTSMSRADRTEDQLLRRPPGYSKLKKEEENSALFSCSEANNIGRRQNAEGATQGFTRLYLRPRCQTVGCQILLGDLPWLTHVQRSEMDSPTPGENRSVTAPGQKKLPEVRPLNSLVQNGLSWF